MQRSEGEISEITSVSFCSNKTWMMMMVMMMTKMLPSFLKFCVAHLDASATVLMETQVRLKHCE